MSDAQEQDKTSSIDKEILLSKKHFYGVLMSKKRNIRRNFLQMNAIANEHLLQTLSYRTMLQPSSESTTQLNENIEKQETLRVLSSPSIIQKDVIEQLSTLSTNLDPGPEICIEQIDNWLDAETDLEIQRILQEETKS